MSVWSDLYNGRTHFDIVSRWKRWFTASGVALVIAIISLATFQLDLSIDFTGGTIITAENSTGKSVAVYRTALVEVGQEGAKVQITGSNQVVVQTESLDSEDQDALVNVVADTAGVTFTDTNVEAVGPTFGEEITRKALQALVIFLLVIAGFISWRFHWKMALAALAALTHDLIITTGLYALIGFPVTPATVIAILTILGYSLYDTVVVFDKIEENTVELHGRYTFTEIANLSLNQVLMRSINTSFTSLLPIGSLLFVGSYLLGAATLREFALALFIGVSIGTYSSIFIATPLLALWKEREPEWQRTQRRRVRKAGDDDVASVSAGVADAHAELRETGAVPRPPRKRKKRR
ncbi:MAG: protein translocase subunit SecF [Acidimicrobiia bacterium]